MSYVYQHSGLRMIEVGGIFELMRPLLEYPLHAKFLAPISNLILAKADP
jgi:hypothetical protein